MIETLPRIDPRTETDAVLHDLGAQLGLAVRLLPDHPRARRQVLYAIQRLHAAQSALDQERREH